MDLRAYLDILRRRGWIILLAAVLAGVGTFGISLKETKIWQATVRISAVPARPDWGLTNTAQDLLRNFVDNINTHDMASQVIAKAQLDMTPEELLSKITVSTVPEDFLIRIDGRDQDPQVATQIVLTMAQLFTDERVAYYNTQDKADRIEVKIVDSVIEPVVYKPKPLENGAAGLVLGALIGMLIVLGLEWAEGDILATPEAIQRHLGLPVLGAALAAAGATRRSRYALGAVRGSLANKGTYMTKTLVSLTDPASPAAEAFRRLRINLGVGRGGTGLRTLLVAAAGLADDKASVAANLAVAFARIGKRTVLVDCDLRHPGQHALFGLTNQAGVSSALENPGAPLPLQESAVPCLRVLASGPAIQVPSDLIASPQMAALIGRLREEADVVIFDAPPVVVATDTAELAGQVDGVLLTVSAGQTKRQEAQQAKEMLERAGAHIVGVALINVAEDAELRKYLAN
jgi:non-specific protein-tyrosine kinase